MGDIDWDSDPELKRLRNEFLDSLPERCTKILTMDDRRALRQEIHRLAGAAGSYDCLELFSITALLDEVLADATKDAQDLSEFITLLKEAMTLQYDRKPLTALMSSQRALDIQKNFGKFRV